MITFKLIEYIREINPLIHNITNQVVANDVANSLIAVGASPMMAYAPEEMADIGKMADASVLNIGTLTSETLEAMLLVGKSANERGVPVILDPVGVGSTTFRQKAIQKLLSEVKVQLIRGNAGELASLANVPWIQKGVDAGQGTTTVKELAELVAKRYQTVVAISGEEDIVSDGIRTVGIFNGHPLMTQITGTGCMLSGICGAFAATAARTTNSIFDSTVEACILYAVAGELAVESLELISPGNFRAAFMDSLYNISSGKVIARAKVKQYPRKEN